MNLKIDRRTRGPKDEIDSVFFLKRRAHNLLKIAEVKRLN
jgi:hypothetical protein